MKVLSAGSVDDGKSTLLGRLLYDLGCLPDDLIARLAQAPGSSGAPGVDYALAFDGLLDERAQGITIDVAWCPFKLDDATLMLADCPGHAQYTRNMVSAASQCDATILLVDAVRGVTEQTRRHLFVCSLMRIRHLFVAVNKVDLVPTAQATFSRISAEISRLLSALPNAFAEVTFAPTSGLHGVNVSRASPTTPWYTGPSLVDWMRRCEQQRTPADDGAGFAMPVQRQNRPSSLWRGYDGTVLSGQVRAGRSVQALPSGASSTVAAIHGLNGPSEIARAGQAVSIMLADPLDLSRGEVLVGEAAPVVVSEIVEAHLVWLSPIPASPGARHTFRLVAAEAGASVSKVHASIDMATLSETPPGTLVANSVARVEVMLEKPVALTRYADSRDLGGFLLVDMNTRETLAAGMVIDPAPRQIFWQDTVVSKDSRARRLGQQPMVIWLTGLSGAGKSTIANAVESALHHKGHATYLLDGDNIRHGLCRDLGFSEAERAENLRRVGEVARLMVDAGLIVLASFISPSARERDAVAGLFEPGEYAEVHVSTPLHVCEARDPKGLYRQARAGTLAAFTGVSAPYDTPAAPSLALDTSLLSLDECVRRVVALVKARQ